MTIEETIRHLRDTLAPAVGRDEAAAMSYAILEDIKGYTRTQLIAYGDRELLPETSLRIENVTRRILDGEPMQYATGKAHWHGRVFAVDSSVLIPRPETAQLVDIITDTWASRSDLHVLDVGTGSGCIAITLALDLPFSRVTAVDISGDALALARKNAAALKARINFVHGDAFSLQDVMHAQKFDIVVSNPPYVLESERASLDPRVADHEPAGALFVRDEDPIAIYTAIARYAATSLKAGGRLYFEINPLCAKLITDMLSAMGFTDVETVCDYLGAKRFIICRQPS